MLLLFFIGAPAPPIVTPPPPPAPAIIVFARPAVTLTPYRTSRRTGRAYDYRRSR